MSIKKFSSFNTEAMEVGDCPVGDESPKGLLVKKQKGKVVEAKDPAEYDQEGDMAKSDLRSIMANAKRLHDMIEDADNLPEWCQNKITLAEDYISTVANYLTAEMNESDVYGKPTTAKTPTVTLKHKTSGKEIVVTKSSAAGYNKIGYKPVKESVAEEVDEGVIGAAIGGTLGGLAGGPLGAVAGGYIGHKVQQNHAKEKALKAAQARNNPPSKKVRKEEVEPVNEITQKLAGDYLTKVTRQNLQKHGMQHDMYGKLNKNRQQGVSNAFKRLEVDKKGQPVHHLVTKEETEQIDESRGHKVLATFFKNREVAQRAFQGNSSKDAKVTQKDDTSTPKKDAKDLKNEENVNEQLYKKNRFVSGKLAESRKADIVKEIAKKKKTKSKDEFQAEPELSTTYTKTDQSV